MREKRWRGHSSSLATKNSLNAEFAAGQKLCAATRELQVKLLSQQSSPDGGLLLLPFVRNARRIFPFYGIHAGVLCRL